MNITSLLMSSDWAQKRKALRHVDLKLDPATLSREERALCQTIALEGLKHSDSQIRAAAAWALAKVGDEQAAGALSDALRDHNTDVRWGAAVAFRDLQLSGGETDLAYAMTDPDHSIRAAARLALRDLASVAAVEPLIRLLRTPPLGDDRGDPRFYQSDICEILGIIGDDRAVPALVDLVFAPTNDYTPYAATQALRKIGSQKAIQLLVSAIGNDRRFSDEQYHKTAEILSATDVLTGVNALVRLLDDPRVNTRCNAIRVLGYMGADIAKSRLEKRLDDDERQVREAATWALARLQEKQLRTATISQAEAQRFLDHPDPGVVVAALNSLGPSATDIVFDKPAKLLLESTDFGIQEAACLALSRVGGAKSANLLFRFLKRPGIGEYARQQAAKALGPLATPELLAEFEEFLKGERDRDVLSILIEALEETKHPDLQRLSHKYKPSEASVSMMVRLDQVGPSEGAELDLEETPPRLSPASPEAPHAEDVADVSLGASVPRAVSPGDDFTITFAAYAPELEAAVAEQLAGLSRRAKQHLDIKRCRWRTGAEIDVILDAEGLVIDDPRQSFEWDGRKELVFWDARVTESAPPGTIVLKFEIFNSKVRVARFRLDLEVARKRNSQTIAVTGIRTAKTGFASYASGDTKRVLDMIQAITTNAGIDIFQDRTHIKSGEDWWKRIEDEIRARDIFMLFWSAEARQSDYVNKEWRFAREVHPPPDFQVHPLDPPSEAPAPRELAHLHFGNLYTYVRRGS